MWNPFNHPFLILGVSFVIFWISSQIGALLRARRSPSQGDEHEDFTFILGATLTLLGLIIGFTFSMAVSRYDQRKYFEEQEANAIGTEYVRADFLPAADAAEVRILLKRYLAQRILEYKTGGEQQLRQINSETARLQTELWAAIRKPATAEPTPVAALVVAGMNDVLNSQGYTQFAWWNRVPHAAWILMIAISIFCNLLVGYVAHGRSGLLFLILPIALSISLFLIADIDSPRFGLIRLPPQNMESLAQSLPEQ
jgi:hypothetical protein